MDETQEKGGSIVSSTNGQKVLRILGFFGMVVIFLISLSMMSSAFTLFGTGPAKELLRATSNPFIGLFVGILVTAILQSSSTTTSLVVAMVAGGTLGDATDPETISRALPLIMGANIGTTVTSTIVSLGHITSRKEYRKAFATATLHDFFNIFTVIILFPLELFFGVLSRPATAIASYMNIGAQDAGSIGFMDSLISPLADYTGEFFLLFTPEKALPFILLPIALLVLFLSLRQITLMLKNNVLLRDRSSIQKKLFRNPWKSLGWGTLITGILQSSSASTSLVVPLVATGKVSMKKAFPFIMGANVGTTTTALIAAFVIPGSNPAAAIAIAICHLLFNLIGVLIFFPVPRIRLWPVQIARRLGKATLSNRLYGILYILVVFFLIPFLMVAASSLGDGPADSTQMIEAENGSMQIGQVLENPKMGDVGEVNLENLC